MRSSVEPGWLELVPGSHCGLELDTDLALEHSHCHTTWEGCWVSSSGIYWHNALLHHRRNMLFRWKVPDCQTSVEVPVVGPDEGLESLSAELASIACFGSDADSDFDADSVDGILVLVEVDYSRVESDCLSLGLEKIFSSSWALTYASHQSAAGPES